MPPSPWTPPGLLWSTARGVSLLHRGNGYSGPWPTQNCLGAVLQVLLPLAVLECFPRLGSCLERATPEGSSPGASDSVEKHNCPGLVWRARVCARHEVVEVHGVYRDRGCPRNSLLLHVVELKLPFLAATQNLGDQVEHGRGFGPAPGVGPSSGETPGAFSLDHFHSPPLFPSLSSLPSLPSS